MLDIIEVNDGEDLKLLDSIVSKAGNVLSIQLGSLEYSQLFGLDLRFFLTSDFQFQNDSLKAYMVQRLTEHQVNVAEVLETIDYLFMQYTFEVGDTGQNNEGLIL